MLHPLTHGVIAVAAALAVLRAPGGEGVLLLLFGLGVTLAIPSRTETRLARPFLRVLGIAFLLLFLIHGVRWTPPGVTRAGCFDAVRGFVHIGAPVAAVLYLSRQIRAGELLSVLLSLRVPPAIVLILFRTLWLVPRMTARMEETLLALRLRGMPAGTVAARVRALVPALGTIFASMFAEISDNSITIAARGFLAPCRKTHLLRLRFGARDGAAVALSLVMLGVVWF